MRPDRRAWAMSLASVTALRATCLRRRVGCVLLDARGRVLSTGYNGVASGMPHCDEEITSDQTISYPNACLGAGLPSGQGLDLCEAVHAEANALLQCRDVDAIVECYTTTSPCVSCVKLLLNCASCSTVWFLEEYAQPEAGRLWIKAGRAWIHYRG